MNFRWRSLFFRFVALNCATWNSIQILRNRENKIWKISIRIIDGDVYRRKKTSLICGSSTLPSTGPLVLTGGRDCRLDCCFHHWWNVFLQSSVFISLHSFFIGIINKIMEILCKSLFLRLIFEHWNSPTSKLGENV